jgi:predicted nucleic acid-binding protein
LDTYVVIELGGDQLHSDDLPDHQWISSVTLGELSVGPLAAATAEERARRQLRLQVVEATFAQSILAYDADAARTFGRVVANVIATGRSSRSRTSDLQLAAIAITHDLPLHTVNVDASEGSTISDSSRFGSAASNPRDEASGETPRRRQIRRGSRRRRPGRFRTRPSCEHHRAGGPGRGRPGTFPVVCGHPHARVQCA